MGLSMKKIVGLLVVLSVAAIGWYVWNQNSGGSAGSEDDRQVSFDTKQHSLDDPASIWVIANKRRPLQPTDYSPGDLVAPDVPLRLTAQTEEMQVRAAVAAALEDLVAAAGKDGLDLMVSSAYRSYAYQEGLYNTYVRQQGQAVADTQSARPGHSEHQTGLAVDIEPASRECEIEECFGDLPEGKWVAANAYKYGFVVRYAKGKDHITGYIYEPWHLRYVGKPLAAELHRLGNPTLEEFFELDPAPDYQ
jgi:D-alanyl-D-alanine carboxypeptidase